MDHRSADPPHGDVSGLINVPSDGEGKPILTWYTLEATLAACAAVCTHWRIEFGLLYLMLCLEEQTLKHQRCGHFEVGSRCRINCEGASVSKVLSGVIFLRRDLPWCFWKTRQRLRREVCSSDCMLKQYSTYLWLNFLSSSQHTDNMCFGADTSFLPHLYSSGYQFPFN